MTLSRWRRISTGIAAGVIVLCAALVGASMNTDGSGVSVASDLIPATVIPIAEEPESTAADAPTDDDSGTEVTTGDEADAQEPSLVVGDNPDAVVVADDDAEASDPDAAAQSAEGTAGADNSDTDSGSAASDTAESASAGDEEEPLTEPVTVGEADPAEGDADSETAGDNAAGAGDEDADGSGAESATTTPAAPLTSADDALGTGGGVDDAECALDRLVIYAGARRGGVAGSIRAALTQAGFGAGCAQQVTILASNCPQQFAGVLGANSGYDPMKSYVASSSNVDRATMTAVMDIVGYAGAEIDILDFGFVNPDRPGEQWMAIFVPPSFAGWEDLAARTGLSPTTTSLCASSGELA